MKQITASEFDILKMQLINELTEAEVYAQLARLQKNPHNKDILNRIAREESAHAEVIAEILNTTASANKFKVFRAVASARILGLTFSLKLMERGEDKASKTYNQLLASYPQLAAIAADEDRHEDELIEILNDGMLDNMGAIVLGLNDALVELTGALAGFTFALGEPRKIATTGLITGLAAAMSMAASAFLSARADAHANKSGENAGDGSAGAGRAAFYTGIAYVCTVVLLIAPYLIFSDVRGALGCMIAAALGIIAFFNFYLSVARDTSFRRGFSEMALISTTVAAISFGIGYILK